MWLIRLLVTLVDAGFLGWIFWVIFVEQDVGSDEWPLVLGLITIVSLNIYFVLSGAKSGDWLGLFLKRKALEEKKKIEALESKK